MDVRIFFFYLLMPRWCQIWSMFSDFSFKILLLSVKWISLIILNDSFRPTPEDASFSQHWNFEGRGNGKILFKYRSFQIGVGSVWVGVLCMYMCVCVCVCVCVTQCDTFYVRENKNNLSSIMNSHHFSSKNPDNFILSVAIHTKSH